MILQLRIDERLVHGQIVTSWSKALDVDMICVANDFAANDQLTKSILLMAAPAGRKVNVRTVEDTIRLLNDPRASTKRILVICDSPKDAIALVKGINITEVNVANYIKKKSDNKVTLTTFICVDKEDIADFKELCNICNHVYSQMVPTSPVYEFKDLLNKIKEVN